MTLEPGRAVVYDEPLKLNDLRQDLIFYPVPFDKIVAEVLSGREAPPSREEHDLRRRPRRACSTSSSARWRRRSASSSARSRRRWRSTWARSRPATSTPPSTSAGSIRIGCSACTRPTGRSSSKATPRRRWAACSPAVTVVAWYPITPSSSLPETLIGYMRKYRMDKDGKATFAIVQAEDEIAALGMVMGASWAGARAMTSTSGPGISLMSRVRRPRRTTRRCRPSCSTSSASAPRRACRRARRRATCCSPRSTPTATRGT